LTQNSAISMKLIIIVFLFTISFMVSFAQVEPGYEFFEDDSMGSDIEMKSELIQPDSKFEWHGSVGAGYMYSKNFGSVNSLQGSYGFSRPLNSRFSVGAGVLVSSYFPVTGFFNHSVSDFQNFSDISIYGTGSYQLNERIVLYGTGIKHLVEFGPDNPFSSHNFNEISIGTSLKLSNNISIGASVHFVDRPVYYSPSFNKGPGSFGFPNSW
jgi:hypothetical protein